MECPRVRLGGGFSLPLHAVLLAPTLIVLALVILYPIVSSAALGFFNYDLTNPRGQGFAGVDNFTRLANDANFWRALKNTLVFSLSSVAFGLVFGLAGALALNNLAERHGWLRGVLLLPWVIPTVVVGYLFLFIFDVDAGLASYLLMRLGIIDRSLPWLMRGDLAMAACIIANVWNQTPFYILMFAAGLKTIPQDIREATVEMGASRWQEFRHVTLPFLWGLIVITSLLMIIRNFNNFPIVYTMTGGGPAYETTTFVIYIYRLAFDSFKLGYAGAVGFIWCIVLAILAALYVRALTKES
ncbi:MAG: sugar ABC transporter permease [Planctomycetota bacterium]|nr:sugar ABC transporter permease [Planctomycetota bacterium]